MTPPEAHASADAPRAAPPVSTGTSARPRGRLPGALLSLLAGLAAALVLHYLLYRVGLPSKPFIYVAF
jgi:hypothetical protein